MSPLILTALVSSAQPALECGTPNADPGNCVVTLVHTRIVQPIVITTSLEGETIPESEPVSLIERDEVDALSPARFTDLLRLFPSASLSETGSPGSQAQLRIRGAEANHTLLFIDGIKANDPAAANEARFELLALPLGNSVELVRGPRSALWGAEALGGVVAVRSGSADTGRATIEAGSNGFARADGAASLGNFTLAAGYQRADGFDSFDGNGDKDGYSNLSARLKGLVPLGDLNLWLSAFAIDGTSEYDGFDRATFLRADTLDSTDNRLGAARIDVSGAATNSLFLSADASFLASENENFLDDTFLNRTSAERFAVGVQASHDAQWGTLSSKTILALRHESEWYRAADDQYGGFTDQQQQRGNSAIALDWSLDGGPVRPEFAIRHDIFTDFEDATSIQAGLSATPLADLTLFARYGTGIAQPSFTDLYGFFPGSFVGNPNLAPERSRGGEVGAIYGLRSASHVAITLFDQTLTDEIVSTFDSVTYLSGTANSDTDSRRRGIEVEGQYKVSTALRIAASYSYLDATEASLAGTALKEVRRPAHRAALILTGEDDRLTYGATLAYVGERLDTDFDTFPATRVRLSPYALLDARVAYGLSDRVAVSLRGRNLFDAEYQDVVGYRTAGRGIYAGIDLRL